MIVAIDVHYKETYAKAVSVEFEQWEDEVPSRINEVIIQEVHEYIPGEFYKRELPCILAVLKETPQAAIDLIIVDGYVTLDDTGKLGLGGYLSQELGGTIPIVGVAKKKFVSNGQHVIEIKRGKSDNPLYITSQGIDLLVASQKVSDMKGKYRMPDLLRILDQKTKEA